MKAVLEDRDEVIAAFVDGEAVEARALDRALADAGGRAHLLDLLALRGLVGDAGAVAGAVAPWGAIGSRAIGSSAHRTSWWSSRRWTSAAAALLVAGAAGGYAVGRVVPDVRSADDVVAPIDVAAPALDVSAPAPTRVIQLEPGKDWNESAGGN
jgi:hypothetical protein